MKGLDMGTTMATMATMHLPMRDIAMAQQKAVSAKVAYWDMDLDRAGHEHASNSRKGFSCS